jgi:hypothetical protein
MVSFCIKNLHLKTQFHERRGDDANIFILQQVATLVKKPPGVVYAALLPCCACSIFE